MTSVAGVSFYDRKAKQTNPIIATKALACKPAKAAWHVMKADDCARGRALAGSQ
jgi:hypothetical protein